MTCSWPPQKHTGRRPAATTCQDRRLPLTDVAQRLNAPVPSYGRYCSEQRHLAPVTGPGPRLHHPQERSRYPDAMPSTTSAGADRRRLRAGRD